MLTRDQVLTFLRSLRRYRDLAIVYLMLLCGLRSKEVLGLSITDLDYEDNRIRIQGKGGRERLMPMPDVLRRTLKAYQRLERPETAPTTKFFVVLQGPRKGNPMTPAGLRWLFRQRRLNPLFRSGT